LITLTHTSRQTNAPDISAHKTCFHSVLTYSSTTMMCPTAPTTSTTAKTAWTTCHASYDSRSGLRQTDVATSATSDSIAAMPNQTNSGAASAFDGVNWSQLAEIAKWTRMKASPT
jgi:hypothetical protein